jgi:glycosyltransferase involved in cell wall biosynthesis
VVNQTLRDIEILCVNDGSDDGSMKILKEYAAEDKRIRILCEPRANAGAARNLGMSEAKGEYLSFLDSDDFFEYHRNYCPILLLINLFA